ncbi:MAG: peptide-methionine (S)-S-oxide reductase MsrA [Candidatus Bathyarchaeota archaeon]|nr:MAG: peptide-methionine (S)-S-oxide reductase MsrA [Candidatus Bathyarchaeota archaeon]
MPQESKTQNGDQSTLQEAITLGGGCFWCTEAIFSQVRGVEKTEVGYMGGHVTNPSYAQVTTGLTGHAEVVQVTFNPRIISVREILEIFFATHDPTTLNRQGADVGPQYRSVIFYHNPSQNTIAEEMITTLQNNNTWKNPIVTQVEPLSTFYTAEPYHQEYFQKNPEKAYCQLVIAPKYNKFKAQFKSKITAD